VSRLTVDAAEVTVANKVNSIGPGVRVPAGAVHPDLMTVGVTTEGPGAHARLIEADSHSSG
jgi:hypothetical protein